MGRISTGPRQGMVLAASVSLSVNSGILMTTPWGGLNTDLQRKCIRETKLSRRSDRAGSRSQVSLIPKAVLLTAVSLFWSQILSRRVVTCGNGFLTSLPDFFGEVISQLSYSSCPTHHRQVTQQVLR